MPIKNDYISNREYELWFYSLKLKCRIFKFEGIKHLILPHLLVVNGYVNLKSTIKNETFSTYYSIRFNYLDIREYYLWLLLMHEPNIILQSYQSADTNRFFFLKRQNSYIGNVCDVSNRANISLLELHILPSNELDNTIFRKKELDDILEKL